MRNFIWNPQLASSISGVSHRYPLDSVRRIPFVVLHFFTRAQTARAAVKTAIAFTRAGCAARTAYLNRTASDHASTTPKYRGARHILRQPAAVA